MNTATKLPTSARRVADPDISTTWTKFSAEGHSDEIRNELVVHYLPWVNLIARKLSDKLPSSAPDSDELAQAGVFGLMDAIEAFRLSVPARKWAIIPEPGEPLRNVAIPVGDHVRRTQMADRLQRNDGFFVTVHGINSAGAMERAFC